MISREEAANIARSYAIAHDLGESVRSVVLLQEITGRVPMIYAVALDNCWIAYIENRHPLKICSSTIVVVGREQGNVIYGGSAMDEG